MSFFNLSPFRYRFVAILTIDAYTGSPVLSTNMHIVNFKQWRHQWFDPGPGGARIYGVRHVYEIRQKSQTVQHKDNKLEK